MKQANKWTVKDVITTVLLTVLLGVLCVVWLYPVLLILINSLKDELGVLHNAALRTGLFPDGQPDP